MPEPTADKATFTCVARRHMDAEFRVYDAMLAICKAAEKKLEERGEWKDGDALPLCFVREHILANMVDRSIVQVSAAIEKLLKGGWIQRTHDAKRQRRRKGDFTSNEYRVVEHDEYVKANPASCPSLRYEPETGEPIKPGRMAKAIERARIREMAGTIGPQLPDAWLDAVADGIHEKKTSIKGNPCLDDSAREGNPFTTRQGNPLTATKGNPLTSVKGNPLTSLKGEAGTIQTGTISPPAPENAPGATSKGGQAGSLGKYASSTKTLWREFISKAREKDLVGEMLNAMPKPEEIPLILALLEKRGDIEQFVDDINDWAEEQSPPLFTLQFGRWSRWLEQAQDVFEQRERELIYELAEKRAAKSKEEL